MNSRYLLIPVVLAVLLASSGCSNRLADENEKLRKQALDLQREIVALKTDKKILEEKTNKLTGLVPPELLPVEELVTKLPAENRLGKIPARSDIIRYAEQNINRLAQGKLGAEGTPWKITKFTFIPPDLVYVDYESGAQKERILLAYSLLEAEGISTELKAYFQQNTAGVFNLVRGEDADHIATPLVYVYSAEKGQWLEITRIGATSGNVAASSLRSSTQTPAEASPLAIRPVEATTPTPVLANPRVSAEKPAAATPVPPAQTLSAPTTPTVNTVPTISSATTNGASAVYYNKWHNYTVAYPSQWYFWGMGQTDTALFRTAFAQTEVTTTNALVTIDVIAGTATEIKARYPTAKVASSAIAGKTGWHLILLNGTELYVRDLTDKTSLVFTGVESQANVLANMVNSFQLNG